MAERREHLRLCKEQFKKKTFSKLGSTGFEPVTILGRNKHFDHYAAELVPELMPWTLRIYKIMGVPHPTPGLWPSPRPLCVWSNSKIIRVNFGPSWDKDVFMTSGFKLQLDNLHFFWRKKNSFENIFHWQHQQPVTPDNRGYRMYCTITVIHGIVSGIYLHEA